MSCNSQRKAVFSAATYDGAVTATFGGGRGTLAERRQFAWGVLEDLYEAVKNKAKRENVTLSGYESGRLHVRVLRLFSDLNQKIPRHDASRPLDDHVLLAYAAVADALDAAQADPSYPLPAAANAALAGRLVPKERRQLVEQSSLQKPMHIHGDGRRFWVQGADNPVEAQIMDGRQVVATVPWTELWPAMVNKEPLHPAMLANYTSPSPYTPVPAEQIYSDLGSELVQGMRGITSGSNRQGETLFITDSNPALDVTDHMRRMEATLQLKGYTVETTGVQGPGEAVSFVVRGKPTVLPPLPTRETARYEPSLPPADIQALAGYLSPELRADLSTTPRQRLDPSRWLTGGGGRAAQEEQERWTGLMRYLRRRTGSPELRQMLDEAAVVHPGNLRQIATVAAILQAAAARK